MRHQAEKAAAAGKAAGPPISAAPCFEASQADWRMQMPQSAWRSGFGSVMSTFENSGGGHAVPMPR